MATNAELLSRLDSYDWNQAFQVSMPPDAAPSFDGSRDSFTTNDVSDVYAIEDGTNDEADWILVGRLNDSRWFFLSAWCDYAGWDCRAGGRSIVADSKKTIFSLVLTADERQRLSISL